MNKRIDLKDIFPLIEEQLSTGGTAAFTVNGTSMSPLFIHGKTQVCIKKKDSPLEKYDIIFYRRSDGSFILHRIVGVKKDGFVCRGDNQFDNEFPVTANNIIGIVTQYGKDGNFKSVDDFCHRIYSKFWVNTMFLRKFWHKTINFIKK